MFDKFLITVNINFIRHRNNIPATYTWKLLLHKKYLTSFFIKKRYFSVILLHNLVNIIFSNFFYEKKEDY